MDLNIGNLEEFINIKQILKGYKILIRGEPGTLKSTLAFWSICSNCNENDKAVYFSFEENKDIFLKQLTSMEQMDDILDYNKKMQSEQLYFVTNPVWPPNDRKKVNSAESFIDEFQVSLNEIKKDPKIKMIVIDPLSTIKDYLQAFITPNEKRIDYKPGMIRYDLHEIFNHSLFNNVVSFFITEKSTSDFIFNTEDYLVDGIFDLRNSETAPKRFTIISCVKMRGHNIDREDYKLVYNPPKGFSLSKIR